jgi:hypothetical protein
MTLRPRLATLLSASALALTGCFGSSDDKGDNGGSPIITPKPSGVQDANTAGSLNKILPEPVGQEVKAPNPTDAAPK